MFAAVQNHRLCIGVSNTATETRLLHSSQNTTTRHRDTARKSITLFSDPVAAVEQAKVTVKPVGILTP